MPNLIFSEVLSDSGASDYLHGHFMEILSDERMSADEATLLETTLRIGNSHGQDGENLWWLVNGVPQGGLVHELKVTSEGHNEFFRLYLNSTGHAVWVPFKMENNHDPRSLRRALKTINEYLNSLTGDPGGHTQSIRVVEDPPVPPSDEALFVVKLER